MEPGGCEFGRVCSKETTFSETFDWDFSLKINLVVRGGLGVKPETRAFCKPKLAWRTE